MVKDFSCILSQKLDWQIIAPNEKADWINQRNGVFDNLILLGNKKGSKRTFFSMFSSGDITHRDVWCYNSSSAVLLQQMGTTITTYNKEVDKCTGLKNIDDVASIVDIDPTKIKWDKKLFEHA